MDNEKEQKDRETRLTLGNDSEKLLWRRKPGKEVMEERIADGVHLLQFPLLCQTGLVAHGFSTRLGGVSQGKYATMNFTFTRGDNPDHVMENYRRVAKVLGVLSDPHGQCAQGDRGRCGKRDHKREGLPGCGRADHRCAGNYPGDILCRLRSPVFSGSG